MSDLQLIEAVKAENVASIRQLIESGADVNQQDDQGWTPLNWAAGKGHLEMVKLLVENGADVFKVGRDQRTPYLIALAAGRVEVVKYLRQAEENAPGERPYMPERKYCKAYYLKDLRQFPNWTESKINWKAENKGNAANNGDTDEPSFSDTDVVFLHQDYTVTRSMWQGENILFNRVNDEWQEFCTTVLDFKVPDDLDLIVPATEAAQGDPSFEQSATM